MFDIYIVCQCNLFILLVLDPGLASSAMFPIL